MPALANLGKVLRTRNDIVLLTVSTDDSLDDARDTLKSVLGGDVPFEVMIDPDSKVVADRFGTKLYPETWFIDPAGIIRARFDGARDWAGALSLDLAQSLTAPLSCDVEFSKGELRDDAQGVCADSPQGG
ncbi:MAG: redoxin domain-containing protein [Polyangiaceae bacterium]